jgi:hypothetical protein
LSPQSNGSKHYFVETTCSLISSNVVLLDKGQVAENLLKRVFVILFKTR